MNWSALQRTQMLEEAEKSTYDLVIIGGGITGAGILLDAASRGMKAILVEKDDFASGTSSKSTKLIHGGLRYLKQFELGLVREVGRERRIALRNACHLVHPEPMLLPLIKGGSLNKLTARLGLWVYERLAGVAAHEGFKMLDVAGTLEAEPLLKSDQIVGGAMYTEYRTDDARLCISVLKTAISNGGLAVNYAKAVSFFKPTGKVEGLTVEDQITRKQFLIKGHCIVNATGPWVDEVRQLDELPRGKKLHLTQGIHVVFDAQLWPLKQAVYFDSRDGRMIFAIPREGKIYLGTTDTNHPGAADTTKLNLADTQYLVDAFNERFGKPTLELNHLESGWAGVRPLIHQEGKGPSELSRKDEIFESSSGLLSIAGGKLTGYRKMAEKIVDKACKILYQSNKQRFKQGHTRNIKLCGGEFSNKQEIQEYAAIRLGESKEIGATAQLIAGWVNRYGSETETIIEKAYSIWPETTDKSEVLLLAEMLYCRDEEMSLTPADFWIRRKAGLFFHFRETMDEFDRFGERYCQLTGLSEEVARQMRYAFLREADETIAGIGGR